MNYLITSLILVPVLTALISLMIEVPLIISIFNFLSFSVLLTLSIYFSSMVLNENTDLSNNLFIQDPLSAFSVCLIATIAFMVILYSISYLNTLRRQEMIDSRQIKKYYLFFNLFVAAMMVVSLINNIAWSWIAIEATTLSSALLITIRQEIQTLEAAWKYIIICSVGIIVALIGVVLLIISIQETGNSNIYLFTNLISSNPVFHISLLKIAFVLIFIGYGAKLGFFPMHTWLPDAYGAAASPVSAILSAALSPVALIPLMRFKHITDQALGYSDYTNNIFFFFGFITIIFAAIFSINQSDFKRLLAYSSMENMGLIIIAIALSNQFIMIACFLHIIFNALAKTALFLTCGNLYLKYHSHNIDQVRRVFQRMPASGLALMLGIFAIIGLPPFGIFISKFMILRELINQNLICSVIILLALAMIFGSFIHYFNKVLFAEPKENEYYNKENLSFVSINLFAISLPLILLLILGLYIPDLLIINIEKVVRVLIN